VHEVFERLNDAGLRRDVAALEQIYAGDYFHTNPDGSIMRRADVMASYRKPATARATHDDDIWQIHGDTAVVNTRLTTKSAGGEGRFRVTYVFERRGGRWQATNSHATMIVDRR